MCRRSALVALMLIGVTGSAGAAELKQILKQADDYRLYVQSAKVVTRVELSPRKK